MSDGDICPPYVESGITYYCGRLLARRNLESKAARCPGSTVLCKECVDTFTDFMDQAYDARARDKEWQV